MEQAVRMKSDMNMQQLSSNILAALWMMMSNIRDNTIKLVFLQRLQIYPRFNIFKLSLPASANIKQP